MLNQQKVADLFTHIGRAAANLFSRAIGCDVAVEPPDVSVVTRADLTAVAGGPLCIACVPVTAPRPGAVLFIFPPPLDTLLPELFVNREAESAPKIFTELHRGAFAELIGHLWHEAAPEFAGRIGVRFTAGVPVISHNTIKSFIADLPLLQGAEKFLLARHAAQVQPANAFGAMLTVVPAPFLLDLTRARKPAPAAAIDARAREAGLRAMTLKHITLSESAPPPAPAPQAEATPAEISRNLETLLHVGVDVVVELGRTSMNVDEIMGLQPGVVVEMDDPVSRPVGVYVNGKLVARGTVVASGEKFGVQVTEIVRPDERLVLK